MSSSENMPALVAETRPSVPKTPTEIAVDSFFRSSVEPQFSGKVIPKIVDGSLPLLEAIGYISAYSDYLGGIRRTLTQEYGEAIPTEDQLKTRLLVPELVRGLGSFIDRTKTELNTSLASTDDAEKQALLKKELATYTRAATAYPKVHQS